MLKIRPLSVVLSFLPNQATMTWPDTNEIRVTYAAQRGIISFTIDSAAILVPEDIDTLALQNELNKKQGMVPVNVEGFDPDMQVLVYSSMEHPDGALLLCTGSPEPDDDIPGLLNMDKYTKQIWPTPENDT